MQSLSRISVTADNPNLLMIVRLFSRRDPGDGMPDLVDHLEAMGEPWLHHIILDFRRFEADLTGEYLGFLVTKWRALEAGRVHNLCLAAITDDLSLKARLMPLVTAMPHRSLRFFDTFDEGLDWIKARQYPKAA